jgi:hypothetical protein
MDLLPKGGEPMHQSDLIVLLSTESDVSTQDFESGVRFQLSSGLLLRDIQPDGSRWYRLPKPATAMAGEAAPAPDTPSVAKFEGEPKPLVIPRFVKPAPKARAKPVLVASNDNKQASRAAAASGSADGADLPASTSFAAPGAAAVTQGAAFAPALGAQSPTPIPATAAQARPQPTAAEVAQWLEGHGRATAITTAIFDDGRLLLIIDGAAHVLSAAQVDQLAAAAARALETAGRGGSPA